MWEDRDIEPNCEDLDFIYLETEFCYVAQA
jgi:hypothetical protein